MPGAPPDTLVTSAGGLTIHTLPTSNSAGTSDTVALPVQGVTGGVPMPISIVGGVGGAVTQTIITLAAATTTTLIAANASRKILQWMNVGANPATVVPGAGPAVAGSGMIFNSGGAGLQGGAQDFGGTPPTSSFTAISTLGTTVVVWEGN